jgi:hypothetical protein
MSFTKPIGVAYLDQDIIGADTLKINFAILHVLPA